MSNVIRQHNYNIHPVESCIAISPDGKPAVGLYVDDIYKCGPDTTLIDAINKHHFCPSHHTQFQRADSTRPDVAYAAHKLTTQCTNTKQQHVDKLILYTDSSMVDLPGAKATIRHYTLYNNAVVDWKAKQTNTVAMQQKEAKFIAAIADFRAAQYINNIQSLLGPNQRQQLQIHARIDNCGAKQIIQGRDPIKNIRHI
eukprot:Pgem_evm1s8725